MNNSVTKTIGDLTFIFQRSGSSPTKGTLTATKPNGDGNDSDNLLLFDTLDIAKDNLRRKFIDKLLKDHFQDNAEAIKPDVIQGLMLLAREVAVEVKKQSEQPDDYPAEVNPFEDTTPEELKAAMDMLKSDNLFEQIVDDLGSIGIGGEEQLSMTIYLILTSRLLDEPLSAIVQGASSSGKSFIIETIAKLMPSEGVLIAHEFSEKALYYMKPGSLVHRAVVGGERIHNPKGKEGQAQDNSKAFREMVASRVLRKEVVIKNDKGQYETQTIIQPGPIAYIESTTATIISDEDSTRILKLATNESEEQTQCIMDKQKQEAKLLATSKRGKAEIIKRHHTMQRLLQKLDVTGVGKLSEQPLPSPRIRIPFIDKIELPSTCVSSRRTFPLLKSFIRIVTLLRQFHPSKQSSAGVTGDVSSDGGRIIEADLEDYRIAYRLIQPVIAEMYAPLPAASIEMIPDIKKNTQRTTSEGKSYYDFFTISDCEDWFGVSKRTVGRRIWPLVSA